MRRTPHAVAGLLVAAFLATSAAAVKAPPALEAKQARARAVLTQVSRLDIRFGRLVDAWDGARIQLAASRRALAANELALATAKRRSGIADARLAQRIVAIYKSGGEPSLVEVITGASSLGDLIDRFEAAANIASYDRTLADRALRLQEKLTAARVRLRATERQRHATVTALAGERRQIGAMLAQRRRLLSSIRSQIAADRKREAARQQALAAAARARLAHEQAAAEAAAEQAAAAPPRTTPAATTSTQTTTTEPASTATQPPTTATTTTTTATTTTAGAPSTAPGAGYPEAASIALEYLGIPYQWGGASPTTGFDCSGLVMYVYAQLGVQLPHQAAAQYGYGVPVPRDQLLPGDLVFFDDLSHVGIYIGDGEFVHAPQTGDVVKIATLAQFGTRYVGARRL